MEWEKDCSHTKSSKVAKQMFELGTSMTDLLPKVVLAL